jgi:hypothetical protein
MELHGKLWGWVDLFHQVFRCVTLTSGDFVDLQNQLHSLQPSRNHGHYAATNVAERRPSHSPKGPTSGDFVVVDIDSDMQDAADGMKDEHEGGDKDNEDNDCEDTDNESNDDKDDKDCEDTDEHDGDHGDKGEDATTRSYIAAAATLSRGSNAVFPCTIRYMDLTFLNLEFFDRVSQILLIRDEWDAVVDIFNERTTGKHGSAIFPGLVCIIIILGLTSTS